MGLKLLTQHFFNQQVIAENFLDDIQAGWFEIQQEDY